MVAPQADRLSPFLKGEGSAEDPRAGPKLVPLLHTKAPSFQGPAGMMSAIADRGILMGPAGCFHHHLSARGGALF